MLSSGSFEFQTVGRLVGRHEAWQNSRLPNTVVVLATLSKMVFAGSQDCVVEWFGTGASREDTWVGDVVCG